jgi:hypothetical protein
MKNAHIYYECNRFIHSLHFSYCSKRVMCVCAFVLVLPTLPSLSYAVSFNLQ